MRDTNNYKANKVYKWQDATLSEEALPLTSMDDIDTALVTPHTSHSGPTPQSFQQGNSNTRPQVDHNSYGVHTYNRYEPLQQEEHNALDAYYQQDYATYRGWNSPSWAPPQPRGGPSLRAKRGHPGANYRGIFKKEGMVGPQGGGGDPHTPEGGGEANILR